MLLMTVVAKAGDVTAIWDFQHMAKGVVAIQGTTGTVASDVDGIDL